MAVNRNDKSMDEQHAESARRATGEAAGTQEQSRSSGKAEGLGGLFGLNSKMKRTFSRSSAGEEVAAYAKTIRELIKLEDEDGSSGIQALVLDGPSSGLSVSSIIIAMAHQHAGGTDVTAYTLLVESSVGGRLPPRQVPFGNQYQAEITTVVGDLYDDWYMQNVSRVVKEKFGDVRVTDAGYMVIPSEMSHEDRERVRKVLFVADQALSECMAGRLNVAEEPFTVAQIDPKVALNAILEYDTQNDETVSGLPIRSDISIRLQGVTRINQNAQHQAMLDLTKVDGFIDLVYDANVQQQQQNMWGGFLPQQSQPVQSQHFFPRLVITRSDSEGVDFITPELQLLGLATATLLSRNGNWMPVFLPKYDAGEIDLRDLGAVGREINLTGDPQAEPKALDTKSDSFKPEHMAQLIQFLIHDSLIYSMDIEEAGELSWVHGIFMGAANNNFEATQAIVATADNLTGGRFSRKFGNQPLVHDENNRIHLGYWLDEHKNKRDLREIDYLAMINWVGGKDMALVRKFTDTFDNDQKPIELRLEEREGIYKAILNDKFKIKGYARRVTFTPEFIRCLHEACEEAGLVINPQNVTQDYSNRNVRGSSNARDYAVSGLSGGMFQSASTGWRNTGYRSGGGNFQSNGGFWQR